MEIPLLKDIVVIFGLSIVVLIICHRFHIPAVVGFLFTGVLCGPHGLGLVKAAHQVELLAEIGVVSLLFTIGVEFSLEHLKLIKRLVLLGGPLQVLLTIFLSFLIIFKTGLSSGEAVFIGFLVSLSSTAIVLKLLQEKSEIESPHGRTTLGILIFQDIIIVPMMILVPLLAGVTEDITDTLIILILKGAAVVAFVVISAKWIVPKILYQITRTRNRELFILSIVVICLAVAWLTSSLGLSLALGAFLAGLIVSESEYSHQALSNILPFRDVFTSFFFISIGMLFNFRYLLEQPLLVFGSTIGVLVLKSAVACFVALLLGYPLRTALLAGLALSQIGEFSFILSKVGVDYGLVNENMYQLFLAVSIMTMALTPFIIMGSHSIVRAFLKAPIPRIIRLGRFAVREKKQTKKKNHIIVIGYGVGGRYLTQVARAGQIPYVIIEMNPETVAHEKEKGEPILYGDAIQEGVLYLANLRDARVVVIAVSDPATTRRIVESARRFNSGVYIIARTRFIREMEPLYKLGASEVIPEEFETSIELFTRVLHNYLVPKDEIEKFTAEVRQDRYEMLRHRDKKPFLFSDLKRHLSDAEITSFRICENFPFIGKSVGDINLRKTHGVTLLVVKRGGKMMPNPSPDVKLKLNDVLIVMGTFEKIAEISCLFREKREGENN